MPEPPRAFVSPLPLDLSRQIRYTTDHLAGAGPPWRSRFMANV